MILSLIVGESLENTFELAFYFFRYSRASVDYFDANDSSLVGIILFTESGSHSAFVCELKCVGQQVENTAKEMLMVVVYQQVRVGEVVHKDEFNTLCVVFVLHQVSQLLDQTAQIEFREATLNLA